MQILFRVFIQINIFAVIHILICISQVFNDDNLYGFLILDRIILKYPLNNYKEKQLVSYFINLIIPYVIMFTLYIKADLISELYYTQ